MGAAARRPLVVGLLVGLLAAAGGALALGLTPSASTDTLVGRSAASFQAAKRAAQQAQQLVGAEFARNILTLALRYGLGANDLPRLNNPSFVAKIVFDDTKNPGTPKARFAYLFPNRQSALIQVRMRPDLS